MNLNNLNYDMTSHSIIEVINTKKKIIYKKNFLLLFILESNNIHIQSQCRSGYCGTCRIELIKGKVLYSIKQPIAAVFKKREVFPCCCRPHGNISIKI